MNTAIALPVIEDSEDWDITLSQGQQDAYDAVFSFLMSKEQDIFVLRGFAGTGKSTLVKKIFHDLPKVRKMDKLLGGTSVLNMNIQLTATTNKAAEALEYITGYSVVTTHSFLGIIPLKDYSTGKSELGVKRGAEKIHNTIIVIDEASFVDRDMLSLIIRQTVNCKILFIGDPAQLAPIKANSTPVFDASFPSISLTEVLRQAKGNPIIELATAFRETVTSGKFFSFSPDDNHIIHLSGHDFEQAVIQEFNRPDWKYTSSKVLAWTNARVVEYNHAIRNIVQGAPQLQVGDYAVSNQYVSGTYKIKTDQLVYISQITPSIRRTAVGEIAGFDIELDHVSQVFMPASLEEKKELLKAAKDKSNFSLVKVISEEWVDLRAAYACTINKSQGSTYDTVFIDLSDIKRCNSGNQIARMLYVAVSRARHKVIFTGDFV
jgi:hypothetical protein